MSSWPGQMTHFSCMQSKISKEVVYKVQYAIDIDQHVSSQFLIALVSPGVPVSPRLGSEKFEAGFVPDLELKKCFILKRNAFGLMGILSAELMPLDSMDAAPVDSWHATGFSVWLGVKIPDIQMKLSDQNLRNRHPLTGDDKTLAAGRQIQTMLSRPSATACAKQLHQLQLPKTLGKVKCSLALLFALYREWSPHLQEPIIGPKWPKVAVPNKWGTAGTMSIYLSHARCLCPNPKGAHGGKTSCANLDFHRAQRAVKTERWRWFTDRKRTHDDTHLVITRNTPHWWFRFNSFKLWFIKFQQNRPGLKRLGIPIYQCIYIYIFYIYIHIISMYTYKFIH